VAGVARPIGILAQLRLIAALRWRMTWNSLRRQTSRLDAAGMAIGGFFGMLMVIGTSIGCAAGTYALLSSGHVGLIGLLYWVIFVFFQVFPLFAAGFGRKFEFRSLLRFPLGPRTFYLLSLGYGLTDFAAVAIVCWLTAMTIGAWLARPGMVPAMILVNAVFLACNVTLERLIGSWLERVLARRRTRELIFALFVLLSIGGQLIGQVFARGNLGGWATPIVIKIPSYFSVFPPGLAGKGIIAAANSYGGGIALACAGIAGYVVLFGALLWLRLAAQYRGEELSETPAAAVARPAATAMGATAEGRDLRWLRPQVAAVVRKEARYLRRNTFLLMNLLMPVLLVLLLSFQLGNISRRRPSGSLPFKGISAEMAFPGMLAYLLLIAAAPAYNSFAYEGRGIQTYYTAPVKFRDVLQGKNLFLVMVIAIQVALCIAALALRVGIPSAPRFVATIAGLVFSLSGQLIVANWSSLTFPRKLEFGSIRNQRASGMAVLMLFASQIVIAGTGIAIFAAGRWFGNPWLPAMVFIGLSGATLGGYFASLDGLSELAEKKREVLIEALCR